MNDGHIKFLEDAARYFEKRPTNGEDKAYWANVYNAKNCRDIAAKLAGCICPAKAMSASGQDQNGLGVASAVGETDLPK